MYRVLFITDDWDRKKSLKSGLLDEGFSVVHATSADIFKEDNIPSKIDIIVADLERSNALASVLCVRLRREHPWKDLPLVLLIPEPDLGNIDFSWGVDDYLTLPVSIRRLVERLKFFMWRINKLQIKNGFSNGNLLIDFEQYEVRIKGEPVDLTYKEFELLRFLVMHTGKVFTREALLDKVWGYDYYGGTRTVDVHIRRLRSKIETGDTILIETVRNVGYKFIGPAS